jgi:hypothetical protein
MEGYVLWGRMEKGTIPVFQGKLGMEGPSGEPKVSKKALGISTLRQGTQTRLQVEII